MPSNEKKRLVLRRKLVAPPPKAPEPARKNVRIIRHEFHTGGVVNGTRLQDNEVPAILSPGSPATPTGGPVTSPARGTMDARLHRPMDPLGRQAPTAREERERVAYSRSAELSATDPIPEHTNREFEAACRARTGRIIRGMVHGDRPMAAPDNAWLMRLAVAHPDLYGEYFLDEVRVQTDSMDQEAGRLRAALDRAERGFTGPPPMQDEYFLKPHSPINWRKLFKLTFWEVLFPLVLLPLATLAVIALWQAGKFFYAIPSALMGLISAYTIFRYIKGKMKK